MARYRDLMKGPPSGVSLLPPGQDKIELVNGLVVSRSNTLEALGCRLMQVNTREVTITQDFFVMGYNIDVLWPEGKGIFGTLREWHPEWYRFKVPPGVKVRLRFGNPAILGILGQPPDTLNLPPDIQCPVSCSHGLSAFLAEDDGTGILGLPWQRLNPVAVAAFPADYIDEAIKTSVDQAVGYYTLGNNHPITEGDLYVSWRVHPPVNSQLYGQPNFVAPMWLAFQYVLTGGRTVFILLGDLVSQFQYPTLSQFVTVAQRETVIDGIPASLQDWGVYSPDEVSADPSNALYWQIAASWYLTRSRQELPLLGGATGYPPGSGIGGLQGGPSSGAAPLGTDVK